MSLWVDETDLVDEANETNNFSRGNGHVTLQAASARAPVIGSQNRFKSFKLTDGRVEAAKRFNGRTQPPAMMQRVEIIEEPDGSRRAKFLDDEPRQILPKRASQSAPAIQWTQGTGKDSLAKRVQSEDAVVAPTAQMTPMPD